LKTAEEQGENQRANEGNGGDRGGELLPIILLDW